jgi:hypothetical protein
MKPIPGHPDKEDYRDLKSLAERTGRPVAELIRQRGRRGSIFDVPTHDGLTQLQNWTREDVFDEMIRK